MCFFYKKKECMICFEMRNLIKLNCNHKFCYNCLYDLLQRPKKKMICPYCRTPTYNIKNKVLNIMLIMKKYNE